MPRTVQIGDADAEPPEAPYIQSADGRWRMHCGSQGRGAEICSGFCVGAQSKNGYSSDTQLAPQSR